MSALGHVGGSVPVAVPRIAHRSSGGLQLTRRGRLVLRLGGLGLLGVVLLAVLVAGVLLGGGTARGGQEARPLPMHEVVVGPGQTLWQIAERAAPGEDPRDVVLRIVEANRLQGANVRPGTRILVPLSS